MGFSSWSHKELDMTELAHARTHTHMRQDLEGMLGAEDLGEGRGQEEIDQVTLVTGVQCH